MGRSGARTLEQDSTTSPNLEALLSISNMNTIKFSSALGGQNNRKTNGDSDNYDDSGRNNGDSNPTLGQGQVDPTIGSGFPVTAPSSSASSSSSSSLSEAAKRANLMHNMRRIERIELLTHKRKDR